MKRALLISVTLCLSLSLLNGCTLVSSTSSGSSGSELSEAAYENPFDFSKRKELSSAKASGGDATAFLVGEFLVSNDTTAMFDGRGAVTVLKKDGSSVVGYYSLTQLTGKETTVSVNFGSGDTRYAYELISSQGDFTLTADNGDILVFVLKEYKG